MMIRESITLMTVIDVLIIGAVGYSFRVFLNQRRKFPGAATSLGFSALFLGLSSIALFYLFDLATMHVLPLFVPMSKAMAVMEDLHLNYPWTLTLVAVVAITTGFSAIGKGVFTVTDRLRESEARLVNAQRIARLGDWERNIETGEVHWSDQMYDIFAITPDQFRGNCEAFLDRVHPDDRELIQETTRRALSEDAPLDVEYRIVRPDTSERVVHSHGEVEFDAAGKPVRISGTAQDITERKSLEERIRQIQKLDAVGKLAGGVAHEFNNLLFVIKGNSDLLEARLNGDPELRRHVELISRQTKRGSYLTRLLVAYARQQPLRPKKTNINDVIRETAKLLEGSLSDAIEIDTVCAENLWTTMVDRGELECAIVNLAVNAQDAMPEGGKLTVETVNICIDGESTANGSDAEPGEYVKLAVTDTGCGMAAVIAERAFEPFFTTKEVGKGTGLGLSMVYGFVKQSGGYVTIDSEPNNGTTVSVYLPKATEAQA